MALPDGRHLSFPFRVGPDGRTATVKSLEDHVRDEVMQLILTSPGERPFIPEFGGGARRLIFEPNGETTQAMAKAMLSQSLTQYMGQRVTVQTLDVVAEGETLEIVLEYRIFGSADPRRLVFQRGGG